MRHLALDVVEKKSTPNSNGIVNFDHRYSNINLNENYKCSNISSLVQSDSKSKKHNNTFGKQAAVRQDHSKVTVKNTENLVFCRKYAHSCQLFLAQNANLRKMNEAKNIEELQQ
jgi:hypothetical protein